MNRKRNISYIKPEDPHFLKVLKKQAGYDDRNHKFDELDNLEEDFVDNTEMEEPQVVVLKKGDLSAEEAKVEMERIKREELETKADLNQKVIFKSKLKEKHATNGNTSRLQFSHKQVQKKNHLLSFGGDEVDDDDDT